MLIRILAEFPASKAVFLTLLHFKFHKKQQSKSWQIQAILMQKKVAPKIMFWLQSSISQLFVAISLKKTMFT